VLQGFLAVKNEEVGIVNGPGVPWDLSKTSCDVRKGWWPETWACHENAQGIDIVADRSPAHQTGLDQRRATSLVRIVDGVTSLRQALDEELRKLGLEARAIAHLVNRMTLPLRRRPEFVDEVVDSAVPDGHGRPPELPEVSDEVNEGSLHCVRVAIPGSIP